MQLNTENLIKTEAERLQRWFEEPSASVFLRVIESEAFMHEVNAANHLTLATEGGDKTANADAEKAVKTRFAADLINRLKGEKIYKLYTATPASK